MSHDSSYFLLQRCRVQKFGKTETLTAFFERLSLFIQKWKKNFKITQFPNNSISQFHAFVKKIEFENVLKSSQFGFENKFKSGEDCLSEIMGVNDFKA